MSSGHAPGLYGALTPISLSAYIHYPTVYSKKSADAPSPVVDHQTPTPVSTLAPMPLSAPEPVPLIVTPSQLLLSLYSLLDKCRHTPSTPTLAPTPAIALNHTDVATPISVVPATPSVISPGLHLSLFLSLHLGSHQSPLIQRQSLHFLSGSPTCNISSHQFSIAKLDNSNDTFNLRVLNQYAPHSRSFLVTKSCC